MSAAGALHEFAGLPLWVTWRNEDAAGSDKPTKVPYAHTGRKASSTDPWTWGTRAIAEHAAERDNRDGIGLVLAPLGEGRHLGGIDLDACIDDEGTVAAWAREIVELLGSYTEISPSGHGLKIFFLHDPRVTLVEGVHWRSGAASGAQRRQGSRHRVLSPRSLFHGHRPHIRATTTPFAPSTSTRCDAVQRLMEAFADKPKAPTHHSRRHDDDHGVVLDALSSIPGEDDYNEWVRIGMALHAEVQGSPEGYRAFVAWSAKSSKFDARHCEQKWREWDRKPADHLTAGTIIYLARQNGWQDPRRAKSNGTAIETAADVEDVEDIEWAEPEPLSSDTERPPYPLEACPI